MLTLPFSFLLRYMKDKSLTEYLWLLCHPEQIKEILLKFQYIKITNKIEQQQKLKILIYPPELQRKGTPQVNEWRGNWKLSSGHLMWHEGLTRESGLEVGSVSAAGWSWTPLVTQSTKIKAHKVGPRLVRPTGLKIQNSELLSRTLPPLSNQKWQAKQAETRATEALAENATRERLCSHKYCRHEMSDRPYGVIAKQ